MVVNLEDLRDDYSSSETYRQSLYPFLSYAIQGVPFHAEQAQLRGISQLRLLERILKQPRVLQYMDILCICKMEIYGRILLGGTPHAQIMHLACDNNWYGLVEVLLRDIRIESNIPSRRFLTPLQRASQFGHLRTVQLLILYGADVNARGWNCQTALQTSLLNGTKKDVVSFLLENGAHPNAQGGMEGDALYIASNPAKSSNDIVNREVLVDLLLQYGAVKKKNNHCKGDWQMVKLSWPCKSS